MGEREVRFSIEDRFIPATPYERDEVKEHKKRCPLLTAEMEDQIKGEGGSKGQRRANEGDKPAP